MGRDVDGPVGSGCSWEAAVNDPAGPAKLGLMLA